MRAIVLGGGIIGCSVALELARRGVVVELVERHRPAGEASSAALGLLFAHVHATDFRPELLALEQESLLLYPSFVERLSELSGVALALRKNGLVEVALDSEHALALSERVAAERAHHIEVEWLEGDGLRGVLPRASPEAHAALHYPQSYAIDSPLLAQAAAVACERAGVRFHQGQAATELLRSGGAVVGVRCSDHTELRADWVVVASGAWASALLPASVEPVRPVRGQGVFLLPQGGADGPTVTDGRVTAVPRGAGVVVGGTVEEVGFDARATAGGLAFILSRAVRVLPHLDSASVGTSWGGLRPASASGLPRVGVVEPGLVAAVGHFRSGFILAPITALRVADAVFGTPAPSHLGWLHPTSPVAHGATT
jgi:glycine oxidase